MENNSFTSRLKHAWNAFLNKDPTDYNYTSVGAGYGRRPDMPRFTGGNDRTIVTAVYNRIALDASAITIEHVRLDEQGRFSEVINSGLNYCLSTEANVDQTGRAFLQDVVMSMLDEGVVAIVPVDTSIDPTISSSYEIGTLRTGRVTQWYPKHVRIELYNDATGQKEEVLLRKRDVAIVENPLYAVINEQNSTMRRLIHKLSLLDVVDEQSGSGKLDLIIQLPYAIKSEARMEQAEKRKAAIEQQLADSKFGIAYIDSTEHVTQLNRSLDNNLMSQIEYLTKLLFSQLGMTQEILDGTASETAMINYYNRTIEPILSAITDEMKRKFLTKTARSQKQSLLFFRDPFKLVPISTLADLADKFTRNEIMSSNEFRQIVGMKPDDNPKSDMLVNSNLRPEGVVDDPAQYDQGSVEPQESQQMSPGDTPITDLG